MWARRARPTAFTRNPGRHFDPEIAKEDMIMLVVQVNGKVRDRI